MPAEHWGAMVDKSEKFRWLVRVGFAARGLVYILIGYLFLAGKSQDQSGEGGPEAAFDWLQDTPGGPIILYVAAAGLLAYALYRFASAVFDVENYGRDAKGIGHRVGHGASGVAHVILAYTAFQFANGTRQSEGGGDSTREAAATVLSMGLGGLALGIVGAGFLIAAAMQARSAYTGSFMDRISSRAPKFIEPLGRGGYAARAIVFALIGWSLVQSGWLSRGSEAMSLGEAIGSLRDTGILFTLVALGILLFGIFSLFVARYRIIPDVDAGGLKPRLR